MARFACFLLVSLFCISRANAQNIYGTSSISFNASANTGAADCETDLDAEADDGYYAARVTCVVRDPSGNTVATGAYSDDGDRDGYAVVSLSFSTTPGVTYTVTGGHSAAVTVPYDAPEGQPAEYFDEYNFENYVESPNQEIADDYDWFGPGPEMETRQHSISLPPTTATGTAPQIPTSLSAPTFQAVTPVVNGNVVDYFGNVLRTGYCGVYQNNASDLLDQKGAKITTTANFTLTESFSNYTSTYGGTNLPTQSSTQNTSVQRLADTQAFGGSYPNNCPSGNENEAFDQSFNVKIGSTTYPLTTVRHISRGSFNGSETVTVTTKTP